jgi:hypothetical protein
MVEQSIKARARGRSRMNAANIVLNVSPWLVSSWAPIPISSMFAMVLLIIFIQS